MRPASILKVESLAITVLAVLTFSPTALGQTGSKGAPTVWKPPSEASGPPASVGPVDPSKLPDITGLHLGASSAEAEAFMKKWYPKGVAVDHLGPYGPKHLQSVGGFRGTGDGADATGVDLTGPPNAPVVWHLYRGLNQPKVAHDVLVAALRQKYGKETYASGAPGKPTNDSQIDKMWWAFDEQGHLLSQATILNNSPFGCGIVGGLNTYRKVVLGQDTELSTFCTSSYVGVMATITTRPILLDFTLDIVDVPLMVRSAKITGAWAKGLDDQGRQEELQRQKQVKPQL